MSVADVRKEINEAESKRGGHSPEEVLDHVFNAQGNGEAFGGFGKARVAAQKRTCATGA